VWAVQYTNASGQIILDTLEIGDVPEGVRAGRHDFEDSGARLKTILEAYRP
jgi:hydrogenase-1 operon protein HyaF